MTRQDRWFKRPEGEVHDAVLQHVWGLEQGQTHLRERWRQLWGMYDPYAYEVTNYDTPDGRRWGATVTENLIASNVDSVTAIAAATEVRPRFLTDNASWKEQRQAKSLAGYAEGLTKKYEIHEECTQAFKGMGIKGTGFVKVWADWGTSGKKSLRIEEVLTDDVIVDERECRYGHPRQLHHRVFIDRDELADAFPDHREHIMYSQSVLEGSDFVWDNWAGYIPLESHQLVVVESWYLPKGGIKGRHTICIDGRTLLDEEWKKDFFPFARAVWSERRPGYYGIGGGERISGHQRRLDKYNWQLDRWLDHYAMPVYMVHVSDASHLTRTRSSLGYQVAYSAEKPEVHFPPAMSPDMMLRRNDIKDSGYEEFGMSRLTATAKKPSGIESGAALREYRDATTQRFALQEKAFEKLILDVVWLALNVCKELGEDAPEVYAPSRRRMFKWEDVNMDFARIQMQAANNLPTTPSGRRQLAIELSQAGIISHDESRRLLGPMDPLDLEAAMSLYTAALDFIDWQIEEILDGNIVLPEPFMNLELGVWRFQQAYQRERINGCPEEICERLRTWITQAAWMIKPPEPPPPVDPALMGDPGAVDPMTGAPVGMDPMMAGDPALAAQMGPVGAAPMPVAQPVPALAPTAMNLQPQ